MRTVLHVTVYKRIKRGWGRSSKGFLSLFLFLMLICIKICHGSVYIEYLLRIQLTRKHFRHIFTMNVRAVCWSFACIWPTSQQSMYFSFYLSLSPSNRNRNSTFRRLHVFRNTLSAGLPIFFRARRNVVAIKSTISMYLRQPYLFKVIFLKRYHRILLG